MKIFYLSNSLIPSRSANSIHVMKKCQAFAKNGHDVTLFACESTQDSINIFGEYGVEPNFNVIKKKRPEIRGVGRFFFAKKVSNHIKKKDRPDIFYGRDMYSVLMVASIGIPFIFEAHSPPIKKIHQLMQKKLFSKKTFKRLVVISNELKEEYLRLFPHILDGKIIVAHDGADIPVEHENSIDLNPSGLDRLQIGYIGHLYNGKGMEVISELAKITKWADFHVIGGTEEDIKYWKLRLKKAENIKFHGHVSHSLIEQYSQSVDVLLAPYQKKVSTHGGRGDVARWMSPLKIFEYMAAKKPIVSSDLKVLREILENDKTALLVPPNDLLSWYEALKSLRDDKELRLKLSNNAYTEFIENYTWDRRAQNVLIE